MGCLKSIEDQYEGVVIEMSSYNKKNNNNKNNGRKANKGQSASNNIKITLNETDMKKLNEDVTNYLLKSFSKKFSRFSIGSIISIVIATVSATWIIAGKFETTNKGVSEVEKDIEAINKEISTIGANVSKMDGDIYDRGGIISELESKIDNIKDILGISVISAAPDALSYVNEIYVNPNNNDLVSSPITETTCIGTDSGRNPGKAKKLINTTILLTYTEGDKEVYFLGQYNDNYRWNGYCVTNAYYMDGTLYGICESNFENGKRLDYKSFYKENDNEWTYTNRVCTDDGNLGTSISYTLEYGKVKNFTNTNVRATDVLYVDKFIETVKPLMKKYHHGNTSNTKYNDNSGQAYYAEYFEDGTVKTLYQGNFVEGIFNDNTGEAWYIVREADTEYMRFKGVFEKGNPKKIGDYEFENPIDLARINEIIQDKSFECELNWAIE